MIHDSAGKGAVSDFLKSQCLIHPACAGIVFIDQQAGGLACFVRPGYAGFHQGVPYAEIAIFRPHGETVKVPFVGIGLIADAAHVFAYLVPDNLKEGFPKLMEPGAVVVDKESNRCAFGGDCFKGVE